MAGLAAAKTHRQLRPDASIAVIEANTDAGGVWASDRLYPGLRTNNLVGTYEYPDFPMDPAAFGVRRGERWDDGWEGQEVGTRVWRHVESVCEVVVNEDGPRRVRPEGGRDLGYY